MARLPRISKDAGTLIPEDESREKDRENVVRCRFSFQLRPEYLNNVSEYLNTFISGGEREEGGERRKVTQEKKERTGMEGAVRIEAKRVYFT